MPFFMTSYDFRLELCWFPKTRNCESQFYLPFSKMRNCELKLIFFLIHKSVLLPKTLNQLMGKKPKMMKEPNCEWKRNRIWHSSISEVVSVDHGGPERGRGEWPAAPAAGAAAPGPPVLLPPVEQSPGEPGTGFNAVSIQSSRLRVCQ